MIWRERAGDRRSLSGFAGYGQKALQQRKRTGQIGARHAYSGRKPLIVQAHEDQMRLLLGRKPDMTLKELREALDLDCSLPAIHYVLSDMGLTDKRDTRASEQDRRDIARARKAWRRQQLGFDLARLVFIDESNAED